MVAEESVKDNVHAIKTGRNALFSVTRTLGITVPISCKIINFNKKIHLYMCVNLYCIHIILIELFLLISLI